jgi:hypothetical protein
LEVNIVSALKSVQTSAELGDLISEVEDKIIQGEAEARCTRAPALYAPH